MMSIADTARQESSEHFSQPLLQKAERQYGATTIRLMFKFMIKVIPQRKYFCHRFRFLINV